MTEMPDKGISKIRYNHLNLPAQLKMQASIEDITIDSKYRADGVKLRKQNTTITSGYMGDMVNIKITDYLDGFQYLSSGNPPLPPGGGESESLMANSESARAFERQAYSIEPIALTPMSLKNADLQFFPTAEGFYDYKKDQYIYQYKDHLGNNRVSFGRNSTGALEITDANDYYPFGMNHLESGNSFFGISSYKNYKYNGKELQESGMYDYGARFYMPDIGRWGVVDELSEKSRRFSPYTYALDNPIMFVDPDGREAEQCCGKLWNLTKAYYSGLYQGTKGTLQGTANFVRHPINSTKAMGAAMAKDPVGAMNSQLKSAAKTFMPITNVYSLGYTAATKGANAAGIEAGSDLTQKVIEATVAGTLKGAGNLIGKTKGAGTGAVEV